VQLCRMGPQMTGRVFMGGIDARPDRGAHTRLVTRRVRGVALVFVGGASGTAAREAAGLLMAPTLGEVPVTLAVNVVGAFLLGLLLQAFGTGTTGRRLLIGTGFLGGFTTYSALAVQTVALAADDTAAWAVIYALGTLILGCLAAWLGMACAGPARAERS